MDDPAGAEAPLLDPVAGGNGNGNGNAAWLSEARIKWIALSVITALVMCTIGLLSVGSFSYKVWISTMADMDAKEWKSALFALAGDLTTLFLIYSPLDTFLEIRRVGNVGGRIHIANIAAVVNCTIWTWYGATLETINYSVVFTNLTGVAFHIGYLTVYFICCHGRRVFFFTWMGVGVAVATAIAGICYYLKSAGSDLPYLVGTSGLITGILMYFGATVENMMVAHRTNGEEGMPGLLATMLNAALWTVYAVIIHDISMLVPNGVGLLLCAFQVIQRSIYRFWMPAGELQARLLGALNAMVAMMRLAVARGEGNGATAATDDNVTSAAADDNGAAAAADDNATAVAADDNATAAAADDNAAAAAADDNGGEQ